VGTPSVPVLVGSVGTASQPHSVAVAGRYAYVVGGSSTLQIFDVGIPSAPVSVGSVATSSYSFSLAVAGRYAYVAVSGANMLQIFDVSTSSAPALVGSVGAGNDPYSVAVAGRYAYVVNYADGTFQVFDVSTPSAPVSIGSVTTTSGPESVAVAGRYAYVSDYSLSKLRIFDLGGAYLQQLEAGAMEAGTLQTRDTVTVGNNLDVRGGLTVSASARISGGLSVDNGTISGNGSGLTNLNVASSVSNLTLAGNLYLPGQDPGPMVTHHGFIFLGGLPFIHATGSNNFFAGVYAGGSENGFDNVGVGAGALSGATSANNNIAVGYQAGSAITTGNNNIDIGNAGSSSDNGIIRIGTNQTATILAGTVYAYDYEYTSDRNAKENFTAINARDVLARVAALPVTEWNYRTEGKAVQHIGPMAQDFQAAFGLAGPDDRHIAVVDEGGVALAAIQGLNQKLEEQAKAKDAEIQNLKARLDKLEQLLETKNGGGK
jgi:hypothetical protein